VPLLSVSEIELREHIGPLLFTLTSTLLLNIHIEYLLNKLSRALFMSKTSYHVMPLNQSTILSFTVTSCIAQLFYHAHQTLTLKKKITKKPSFMLTTRTMLIPYYSTLRLSLKSFHFYLSLNNTNSNSCTPIITSFYHRPLMGPR
jgi:hypothetical protein